jgi:hypothetical protein
VLTEPVVQWSVFNARGSEFNPRRGQGFLSPYEAPNYLGLVTLTSLGQDDKPRSSVCTYSEQQARTIKILQSLCVSHKIVETYRNQHAPSQKETWEWCANVTPSENKPGQVPWAFDRMNMCVKEVFNQSIKPPQTWWYMVRHSTGLAGSSAQTRPLLIIAPPFSYDSPTPFSQNSLPDSYLVRLDDTGCGTALA